MSFFSSNRSLRSVSVAGVITGSLFLASCGSGGASEAQGGDIDFQALAITSEEEEVMRELYDSAIESGNTTVTIYAGHHDEFLGNYEAFEEVFPGLTVVPEIYTGAALQTVMDAELESGNHVVDVISNPIADRYAAQGFGDEYTPVTYEMPEWAEGTVAPDQIEDPEGFYHSPAALLFSGSYNTDLLDEGDLPESWHDLASDDWSGELTFMDPSTPGGTWTAATTLLQDGVVDDQWLKDVGSNAKIVAQDQLALQSVSSGEFSYQPLSASASILNAQQDGAPVEIQIFDEDNVIATEKWMLAANAPSKEAGQLFLNYLFTAVSQEAILEAGNFPISQDENVESPYGWPSLAEIDFVDVPEMSVMTEKTAEYDDLFRSITAN